MAKEIDQLTGLLKEEWLKQGLDDELNRAERFGRDLGILMLAPVIPGELERDLMYPVLKKLGRVSKEVLRIVDVGVRVKNKLLFLLPETSVEGVEVATRKIAEKYHEAEFVHSSTGESFQGTFKSAYFVFPSKEKERKDILERLTAALKEVPKEAGEPKAAEPEEAEASEE